MVAIGVSLHNITKLIIATICVFMLLGRTVLTAYIPFIENLLEDCTESTMAYQVSYIPTKTIRKMT